MYYYTDEAITMLFCEGLQAELWAKATMSTTKGEIVQQIDDICVRHSPNQMRQMINMKIALSPIETLSCINLVKKG